VQTLCKMPMSMCNFVFENHNEDRVYTVPCDTLSERYSTAVLGFSKTAFFDMGCVYIDTCSTILLCIVNPYNFKNLPVGLF
jgi:hypothetical protein